MNKFNLNDFKAPPKEFAPMYGWCWNGPISKEETLKQIEKLRDFDIKAFYILPEPQAFRPTRIPTLMDPNYMTAAYLDEYKFAIDKAKEYGMECWLYDEGGWPSGGACGQVMTEYPEYGRRTLDMRKIAFKKGDAFKLSDEDSIAAFLDGKIVEEGYVFTSDCEVEEYYSNFYGWESPGVPDLPDLTRREATDTFIAMTHDKYKKVVGEHLGTTMTMVFTDEPEAPVMPMRQELLEEYERMYGESMIPYLPALFNMDKRDDESIIRIRRWYDMCSKMFCKNFLDVCRNWANENGMKFTGHFNIDDVPLGCMRGKSYHNMRALRSLDVPGIDVIWRQIYPGEPYKLEDPTGRLTMLDSEIRAENRFFPRYASSAAAQIGSKVAMTESFGVYGNGLNYDQMRFVIGFQAVRGVALINPLLVSYYCRNYSMAGERPAFAEYHASGADLGVFNKYMERLSYISTIGKRVSDVALYYPVNDFWGGVKAAELADEFDKLGRQMEAKAVDFDIFDDDVLASAEGIDEGEIRMGLASYKKLVIPAAAFIPEESRAILERFKKGGGKIYNSVDEIESEVKILEGLGKTRTMKRTLDNGELILLFNEDVNEKEIKVAVNGERAYLIDVNEGRVLPLDISDGTATLKMLMGETFAILLTNENIECTSPIETASSVELSGFTFRRTNAFIIGKHELESRDITEEANPIELGCWADRVGIDFSGSGIYETCFKKPTSPAVLDLGDVRYTTEVFVNGKSLGVKVMPPYRYELPEELLSDDNKLEIRVTNTPGNQYQYTDVLKYWADWQLTPYHERQLLFDRDTLDSGLYGPVKILF